MIENYSFSECFGMVILNDNIKICIEFFHRKDKLFMNKKTNKLSLVFITTTHSSCLLQDSFTGK